MSWLTYAFRLRICPIGLFGVSIARGPAGVSRQRSRRCYGIRRPCRALAMMLMLNVPATMGWWFWPGRSLSCCSNMGASRWGYRSDSCSAGYAPLAWWDSATRIISPTFYGCESRPQCQPCAAIVGKSLQRSLVALMGFQGLALATSVAALANGGLLAVLLRQRLQGIEGERLSMVLMKVLVAAAAMAVAAWGVDYVMTGLLPGRHILLQVVRLSIAIGGGLVVLALTAKLLKIEEFDDALRLVSANLARSR